MNKRPSAPGPRRSYLTILLAAAAAGALAAQSSMWASALGTAAAVYAALFTGNQDRRS
ncbi:hypothetical protein ABTX82_27880 [Streptomyces lavendulae]|uniref:hypothetical protein n=1 Tax=Streptomyces lavendulae TaxID=1914 RepID=UPI003329178F